MGMWGEGCYLPGTESPREIAKNNENLQKRKGPLHQPKAPEFAGPRASPRGLDVASVITAVAVAVAGEIH